MRRLADVAVTGALGWRVGEGVAPFMLRLPSFRAGTVCVVEGIAHESANAPIGLN
jgi:hypothetical protein